MRIFRQKTVEDEQTKQQAGEVQPAVESYGESESIPVFKGQGRRKGSVSDKGKVGNASKYRKA